ncbi:MULTISPECIES: MCE family protein [Streptomyces]|uniref:Phospholipid/cholesterol/gamma-HCH transport system substrate-binding protein n=1 Tax=Streptomyces clavifer TaxID=68188 RepID=A0ABS4V1K0_9ACTN|nr:MULTISPECIES: MCE family protein [Streptomyces]KQX92948.1 ABC transporter substrate-binding protein [Streptomyces sp. Root1319]KQZ17389.1 ABC transporter substrate-binding protein [Streptomyces sp. Root55]MBP2357793.1 phospholipid/cholesterol/gamma-HCH transport system substrate-binding protein [Streptomyces clavifer]MDX2742534.1 MCE family protein [Streptomyces sp. NRRL_B-2557]MDX3060963.1 MCE family protein [Streptomyces sp. ND04-05B]
MKRRSLAGPLAKSIVFIVVTVLATTVLALSIANTGVGDTTTYKARFTDATGLVVGDSVRIAGVKVGQVESVEVADKRLAEVGFAVRKGRRLPASVTASIKYLNMVGQRYIDLDQGAGPVGRSFAAGATIPLSRTTPALDLTQLFNGFQPLFEGLSPPDVNQLAGSLVQVLQGEGGTVDSILSHVGSLTGTVAAKDEVIGEVIKNLNTVLKTVNDREAGFDDLVVTLQKLVTGFSGDREPLGEAVTAMGALTTVTADLLQDGRKPLKEDIAQLGRLTDRLDENTPKIESFLQKTPAKMAAITRLASYGSWLNLYLCEAKVAGVTNEDGSAPPTGIAITQPRCLS